jgi:hypothetical protein
LVYRANKNDQSSEIGLIGTLTLGRDFNITYEIAEQNNGGVKSSTFQIQANFADTKFATKATLDLTVSNSGGTKIFSFSGTYSGQIDNAKLTVGFTYTRQKGGGCGYDDGGVQRRGQDDEQDFVWSISRDRTTSDVTITAAVTFTVGAICGEAALNFQTGQGQVAVTAMFSLSNGCHPVATPPQAAHSLATGG